MGYLANFIVYLMAMTGLIGLSVLVFKSVNGKTILKGGSGSLKIVESMSLGARKNLYIIEAEGEKFLIAGDSDRTALISKLGDFDSYSYLRNKHSKDNEYKEKNSLGITGVNKTPYGSMIKNLAVNIKN